MGLPRRVERKWQEIDEIVGHCGAWEIMSTSTRPQSLNLPLPANPDRKITPTILGTWEIVYFLSTGKSQATANTTFVCSGDGNINGTGRDATDLFTLDGSWKTSGDNGGVCRARVRGQGARAGCEGKV